MTVAVDPATRGVRRALRAVVRPALRARRGLRLEGAEHLPGPGARAVLCCNHAAYVDTVALAAALPRPFVVLGAKARLFRDPVRRALLRVAMVGPLEDLDQLLADGRAVLDAGLLVLCYPELGRHPDGLGPFSPWPATLALAQRVPLVPLHLHGTTRGDRGPWRVVVGEALPATGDADTLTARLREAVAALGQ